MTVYYNEINKFAAQWLRNLINAGHIAPGFVDERSIVEVTPNDLLGYTQCHFFAGVGVWSYALRIAGWPDDRKIWTASCPCQPFSTAGKGDGFDDERHLWPHLQWLIQQCHPPVVLGEQVASKDAESWIDLVHADLEALGYAFGCVPFPSASVGAPHLRDRAYWVANTSSPRFQERISERRIQQETLGACERETAIGSCDTINLGITESERRGEARRGRKRSSKWAGECNESLRMADAENSGSAQRIEISGWKTRDEQFGLNKKSELPCPTNGIWRDADWLRCRDGKWRPVEPGSFPLVNGAPSRVGRLRAYGNAINAEQAKIFIESVMEII